METGEPSLTFDEKIIHSSNSSSHERYASARSISEYLIVIAKEVNQRSFLGFEESVSKLVLSGNDDVVRTNNSLIKEPPQHQGIPNKADLVTD